MKLALSGATGLVGSRFFDLLKTRYEIIPISSSAGIDITDRKKIHKFLSDKKPGLIVHLAAKTNVDLCEEDKLADIKKLEKEKVYDGSGFNLENLDSDLWKGSKSAFGINVVGTKNLADFAVSNGIKIIYVSTDFVFDGEKDTPYNESDTTNPIDWYGQTKFWGEKTLSSDSLICRISYPFGHKSAIKKDLIWTLVDLLKNNPQVTLVTDQVITPTFIDDIAQGIDFLIEKDASGIFNLVGNNFLSPYEIGFAIAREFGFPESKIATTIRAKLYRDRAPRPFKVMLKNDKLRDLGFEITDFFEALGKIKQSL